MAEVSSRPPFPVLHSLITTCARFWAMVNYFGSAKKVIQMTPNPKRFRTQAQLLRTVLLDVSRRSHFGPWRRVIFLYLSRQRLRQSELTPRNHVDAHRVS